MISSWLRPVGVVCLLASVAHVDYSGRDAPRTPLLAHPTIAPHTAAGTTQSPTGVLQRGKNFSGTDNYIKSSVHSHSLSTDEYRSNKAWSNKTMDQHLSLFDSIGITQETVHGSPPK